MARVVNKFEFVKVQSPKLKSVKLDFTKGLSENKTIVTYGKNFENYKDAIVRPSIVYNQQSEAVVKTMVDDFIKELRKIAKHVYRPVYTVLKGDVRIKELKIDTKPLDAFESWVESKVNLEPDLIDRAREKLIKCLPNNIDHDWVQPAAFVVREIGVMNYLPFKGKNVVGGLGRGIYGIVAEQDGLLSKSNRSGKTALLKAFITAVFGETRSEIGVGEKFEREIHNGEKSSQVMAVIEDSQGMHRRIIRGRDITGKTSIEIDGKRFKRGDAEQEIFGFLRLSRDDFVKSAFIRSGDLHGIIKEHGKKLYDDMLRWLGLGYWNGVNEFFQVELKKCKVQKSIHQTRIDDYKNTLELRVDFEEELLRLKKRKDELEMQLADVNNSEIVLDGLKSRIKIAIQYKGCELFLETMKGGMEDTDFNDYVDMKAGYTVQVIDARQELEKVQRIVSVNSNKEKEYKSYLKTFNGVCPIDSEKCPRTMDINENDTVLKEKILVVQNKLQTIKEKCESSIRRVKMLEVEKDNYFELAIQQEHSQGFVEKHRKENYEELKKLAMDLAKKIDAFDSVEYEEVRRKFNAVNSKEIYTKRCEEMLVEEKKKLRIINRKIELYQFLVLATSKKGIPSFQIESAVGTVEGYANVVLERMGVPHRLKFVFQRESSKKEDECSMCGLPFGNSDRACVACGEKRGKVFVDDMSFRVTENGREQAFDQDSGGGKDMLALALRISLAKFLGISVLFLDEVCGSLDEVNLKSLVNVLNWLPDAGFKQVFIISHRRAIVEWLLNRIVVKRFENYSKLK